MSWFSLFFHSKLEACQTKHKSRRGHAAASTWFRMLGCCLQQNRQLFSTMFWNISALGKWSLTQQLTLTLVINPTAVQEHTHTIETRKYKNGVYRSDAALVEKLFYLYKIQNLPETRISHPAKRLFWSFQRCYVQCLCCEAWECTHTHSSLKSSLTSDRIIFGMEDVLRPKYAQVCNSCTVLLKHDSFFF